MLLIDVIGLKSVELEHGRAAGDQLLYQVVASARRGLRSSDVLFRSDSDELVAYLQGTDYTTATSVAGNVRRTIGKQRLQLPNGVKLEIEATVTSVNAPHPGASLRDQIAAAKIQSSLSTTLKGHTLH